MNVKTTNFFIEYVAACNEIRKGVEILLVIRYLIILGFWKFWN